MILVFIFCGCFNTGAKASEPVVAPQQKKQVIGMRDTGISGASFAFKLFSEANRGLKENVLVSPFSAFSALSMTVNGAAGETLNQMATVLGVSPGKIDALNAHNKSVFAELNSNKTVRLEIANAVYSDRSTPFKQEFINLCTSLYSAEAHVANFSDPQTVKTINDWCNQKTHGKIPSILDKLSPEEKMVLLNAIYFKGAWQDQFEKMATNDDRFTTLAGVKKSVRMMHKQERFMFFQGEKFRSLLLPYLGRKQGMYIFLPDKDSDVSLFLSKLNEDNWKKWMRSFRSAEVNLSLPKFKIAYSQMLNGALSNMGMPDAFLKGKANFSNLISQPAWISRVLQKTYMDVNEAGTEAAAVTAVVMATESAAMNPDPVIEFRVDRPFVIALVDKQTDEVLFLGTIVDP